ncbi:TonB-dependent receptor [Luminiphilus syltensis NOR5-1B]|uniref:TonB-dependent receptor n=1 Tax=Luminiphilus syltensis NOR5-1B TaxID=565045 RepID=B8KYK6_9GAMM|nr:TonB-dependent receptor [Luminiphilus syltensis]EED34712.1 TonB-dependent receptor [Luminiphilus syltensis NOR5-1B]
MKRTNRYRDFQPGKELHFRKSTLAIACLAASSLSSSVYAQAEAESGNRLEEVVVSARGVSESERDIPVAVEAFNADALRKMNLNSMEAVAGNTPSMTIVRAGEGNGATINIRGVGSTFSSIGIEQSVSTIIDGVYYPQGRVLNESLFDSKQVSILKGPQALFFGKNATAGVVSIETQDPGDEFEMILGTSYEFRAKNREINAIFSGPLTDKLGARLALRTTDASDGLWENPSEQTIYPDFDVATGALNELFVPKLEETYWAGLETNYARLTLDYAASDRLNFNLKTSYSSMDSNGSQGGEERWACPALDGVPHAVDPATGRPVPTDAECDGDWSDPRQPVPPAIAATNSSLNRFDGQMGERYRSYGVTLKGDYELESGKLTGILNYHEQDTDWVLDSDHANIAQVYASETNSFENISAEFRYVSDLSGSLNFVAGAYFQETDRSFNQFVIDAFLSNSAVEDPQNEHILFEKLSGTDGDTQSVYGELIWDITDELQLTGGARWIDETKDSFFLHPYVNPAVTALFTEDVVVAADQSFDDVLPEVTLRWTPELNIMAYVAYKEGFKSGGFSNSGILGAISGSLSDFTFDPETVDGFEAGIKSSFLENSLQVDLTVYQFTYEGLQIDFFNTPVFAFTTSNAGESTAEGVELDLQWAPISGLRLNGSVAYNSSEYDDFIAPCYVGQKPSQGCTIPGTSPRQQLGGEPTALAPEWVGSLSADYDHVLENGLMAGFTVNLQSKSDHVTGSFGEPADVQDDYMTVDAAIRLGSADGRWEVALIGKNLTDEYAIVASRGVPGTGGGTGTEDGFRADRRGFGIEPLTITLRAEYRFF